MSSDSILKTCFLSCGTPVTVKDGTRHYFGGYYHVRLQVTAVIPVLVTAFDDPKEAEDAMVRLGHKILFRRTLEKMAVPEEELEQVRQHLLEAFEGNVLPYLQREGFVAHYIRSEYRKKLTSVSPFYR